MKEAQGSDYTEVAPVQRRVLDLAHRIDPDFAGSLASVVDDDPARAPLKSDAKQHLKILRFKSALLSGTADVTAARRLTPQEIEQVGKKLLGSLMAGRVSPVPVKQTRAYVKIAAEFPFTRAFPLLAWVVENAGRRPGEVKQVASYLRPMFEATVAAATLAAHMATRSAKLVQSIPERSATSTDPNSMVVHAGEREDAIAYLRSWIEEHADEYVKICDPFLGADELEVLRIVRSVDPSLHVYILTSRRYHQQRYPSSSWEEVYRSRWVSLSDEPPPPTDVFIVGEAGSGALPIHDRWIVTKGGGLRIGTSFNSLGGRRESEISVLSSHEAESREREIDRYLERRKRSHEGVSIRYSFFTLP